MVSLITIPEFFYPASLVLGLIFGSFLNVVIHRLPRMLEAQWQEECQDFIDSHKSTSTVSKPADPVNKLSLAHPDSHCPQCKTPIKPWHNIPLVSYILLRGNCQSCSHPIGVRYPLVELASAIVTVGLVALFGPTFEALFSIALSYSLIALFMIDLDHKLLPDIITLPLLWLGLIANSLGIFTDLTSAVWGAVLGYGVLWLVFQLFRVLTGKEGMGYGDFKLLAAIGAWFGWQVLPFALLIAAVLGILMSLPAMIFAGRDRNTAFAFGPYLAIAAWVLLIWRDTISQFIL